MISQQASIGAKHKVLFKIYKTTGTDGNETIGSNTARAIYVGSNCRDDFGDIRFTQSDGETLEDYWLEDTSLVSGTTALIWVEPSGNVTNGDVTLYVYYGKADATDASSGANTFGDTGELFDNFNDASYDTTIWTTSSGTPVEANGYLRILGSGATMCDVRSTNVLPTSMRMRSRARVDIGATVGWQLGFRQLNDSEYHLFWKALNTGEEVGKTRCGSYDGAYQGTLFTGLSDNTWTLLEHLWVASVSNQYLVDDTSIVTHTIRVADLAPYSRFVSYTPYPTLDVDWIFGMRYVAEPSWGATGTEETPPAVGAPAGFSIVPILQGIGILK